jgi:hypothetical protein
VSLLWAFATLVPISGSFLLFLAFLIGLLPLNHGHHISGYSTVQYNRG